MRKIIFYFTFKLIEKWILSRLIIFFPGEEWESVRNFVLYLYSYENNTHHLNFQKDFIL